MSLMTFDQMIYLKYSEVTVDGRNPKQPPGM